MRIAAFLIFARAHTTRGPFFLSSRYPISKLILQVEKDLLCCLPYVQYVAEERRSSTLLPRSLLGTGTSMSPRGEKEDRSTATNQKPWGCEFSVEFLVQLDPSFTTPTMNI